MDLRTESPEPATALEPVELPELDEGPHFFYGLQWWFFGALAIFGFFYLIYDEVRGGRGPERAPTRGSPRPPARPAAQPRRRTWRDRLDSAAEDEDDPAPGSQGPQQPAVDGKHHARQE